MNQFNIKSITFFINLHDSMDDVAIVIFTLLRKIWKLATFYKKKKKKKEADFKPKLLSLTGFSEPLFWKPERLSDLCP